VKDRRLRSRSDVYDAFTVSELTFLSIGNDNLSSARALGSADLSPNNSVG